MLHMHSRNRADSLSAFVLRAPVPGDKTFRTQQGSMMLDISIANVSYQVKNSGRS